MIAQFARWGDSLALRIPSVVAEELAAEEGRSVELRVEDGRLVVSLLEEKPVYQLEELLAGLTPDNLHAEIKDGAPAGHELW